MNRIAIMQPYFFPYIGYFQLVYHSDVFVLFDDVNFIKQGWINRNQILINDRSKYITVPCRNISKYKLIKDIKHNLDGRIKDKLLKKVRLAYENAPFFSSVFPIFEKVMDTETSTISELASHSVENTCNYLQIETKFKFSSQSFNNSELSRSDRLVDICRKENADVYINSIGGLQLYNKNYFERQGILLKFLEPKIIPYKQFNSEFIPCLSILDIMMFNSPCQIMKMLTEYKLR